MTRDIILKTFLSPGDLCTLTAAIESLHRTYPGQFRTDIRTSCDELFAANPHITALSEAHAQILDMHYTDLITESDAVPHVFLEGYCHDLAKNLGIPLKLVTNRPHLYLTQEELRCQRACTDATLPDRYWVVCAGVKRDFTLKQWPVESYQAVIDHFQGQMSFVQVGAAEHDHPRLNGVVDLVGKTSIRELLRVVHHANGGLGPITLLQHVCAAFEKPYVALLGGREPVAWTRYPKQTTFHTIGMLPCCFDRACWRSRVVALHDGSEQDHNLCDLPTFDTVRPVGQCMTMIKPQDVIAAIEHRRDDGAADVNDGSHHPSPIAKSKSELIV